MLLQPAIKQHRNKNQGNESLLKGKILAEMLMNYRNTQRDEVHVCPHFCSLERRDGGQTLHLGIFKLTVLLPLQHSYFYRTILKFLMRKLFHVLRQTLQITSFLWGGRWTCIELFTFIFSPSSSLQDSLGGRTRTTRVLRHTGHARERTI